MKATGNKAAAIIAAEEQGLQVIEITNGINGYPERLGNYGVIGFENWQAAQDFATEHGATVNTFHRRDGWHFWEDHGRVWEPFTPHDLLKLLGDNYMIATNDTELVADRLRNLVDNFSGDFEKIKQAIKNMSDLWDKVEAADEESAVIMYSGEYYDTIPAEAMIMKHDTHLYSIGVIITD